MTTQYTGVDSLRAYLTGAASAGGVQLNSDLSLGGYRSATLVHSLGIHLTNPLFGIIIDYAGGGNSLGVGSLQVTDTNTLAWKDADGDYGTPVVIANGETHIVEAEDNPAAFLRVRRVSSQPLGLVGTVCSVSLTRQLSNAVAGSDLETTTEHQAYRCVMVYNHSAATVERVRKWLGILAPSQVATSEPHLDVSGNGRLALASGSFSTWPDKGWCRVETSGGVLKEIVYYSSRSNVVLNIPSTGRGRFGTTSTFNAAGDLLHAVPGMAIGVDPDGAILGTTPVQSIANELTAPVGVTFTTAITMAAGLDIGPIGVARQVGVWIKRDAPQGAYGTQFHDLVETSFDAVR